MLWSQPYGILGRDAVQELFNGVTSKMTFAGVGLRTSLRELSKQGWKPFAVGAIGEVFIALLTLGLVYGADLYLHL